MSRVRGFIKSELRARNRQQCIDCSPFQQWWAEAVATHLILSFHPMNHDYNLISLLSSWMMIIHFNFLLASLSAQELVDLAIVKRSILFQLRLQFMPLRLCGNNWVLNVNKLLLHHTRVIVSRPTECKTGEWARASKSNILSAWMQHVIYFALEETELDHLREKLDKLHFNKILTYGRWKSGTVDRMVGCPVVKRENIK